MLLIFLFIRGVQPAWKEIHSDFANYYVSAKLVVRGESLDKLYNNEWFQEEIKGYGINTLGKFSPFPPITAWMMIPFTVFSPLQAQRIFTIINLIFLGLGIQMLKQLTGWRTRHCVLFVLGGGLSLVNNVAFGQVYWIMTVFILLSIILYQ